MNEERKNEELGKAYLDIKGQVFLLGGECVVLLNQDMYAYLRARESWHFQPEYAPERFMGCRYGVNVYQKTLYEVLRLDAREGLI